MKNLIKEKTLLMEIIKKSEWVGEEGKLYCPWCRQYQEYGHKDDYELDAVLKKEKK